MHHPRTSTQHQVMKLDTTCLPHIVEDFDLILNDSKDGLVNLMGSHPSRKIFHLTVICSGAQGSCCNTCGDIGLYCFTYEQCQWNILLGDLQRWCKMRAEVSAPSASKCWSHRYWQHQQAKPSQGNTTSTGVLTSSVTADFCCSFDMLCHISAMSPDNSDSSCLKALWEW